MTSLFETYLRSHAGLCDEQIADVISRAVPRVLRRNESLLQEGQVCRYKTFVASGLLRTFGLLEDGSESILFFSPENSWTLDAESYDRHMPSQFNIAAVEKSELLLWSKADFDHLLEKIPELNAFSRQLISRTGYASRRRLLAALSASPEEKYEDFVNTHPQLLSRLPLHMVAAYLGMSLKTLTRIRHAQLHREEK